MGATGKLVHALALGLNATIRRDVAKLGHQRGKRCFLFGK
jgi:hypothetical protein